MVFDPKTFTMQEMAPALVGGIGDGGMLDILVKHFGTKWRKTPNKGVYYIGMDGVQFTLSKDQGDIAMYRYPTVAEFKTAYEKGGDDFWYGLETFYLNDKFKYTGIDVVEALKSVGLWDGLCQ